jgi:hypothetical protein
VEGRNNNANIICCKTLPATKTSLTVKLASSDTVLFNWWYMEGHLMVCEEIGLSFISQFNLKM